MTLSRQERIIIASAVTHYGRGGFRSWRQVPTKTNGVQARYALRCLEKGAFNLKKRLHTQGYSRPKARDLTAAIEALYDKLEDR